VFHHWALYDISADRAVLPEGIGHGVKSEPLGHGVNDYGHPRYDGPCPDQGDDVHRYVFRLTALRVETPLNVPKEPARDLWDRIRPHVLAEATLTGSYASRRKLG
jgi:Raf kinase inhibitor-like YbhB/YbcL family protein